jgi:tetratricopeptide (TPR) repeat protein
MALVFKGEINQGVREFQTVLNANPNFAQAHFDLGFALESTGQTPEAISHYQRALELQPDYPGAKQRLMNLTHSQ